MSKKWYIWYDGEYIPVSEEVYREYKRFEWAEEKKEERESRCIDENGVRCMKDCKACPERLDDTVYSLNRMMEHSFDVADATDAIRISEDMNLLNTLLSSLGDRERFVFIGKYINGKTERELATSLGVSQSTVHKIIRKILVMLKNLFF